MRLKPIQLLLDHLLKIQLIELDLQRFGVVVLGVLNQEHHQEGDDGAHR